MLKYLSAALAAAATLAVAAEAQPGAAERTQADDIIITGRKSGVPLWTVRSDRTTLVLVGAIDGVSKTTQWDPTSLTEALRKADRVMFPEMEEFTASPFKMIGWLAKWKAMGSLPKGQSLGQFAGPEQMRRLAALRARGAVRNDYERRHPFHLALDLRNRAKGDIDYSRNVYQYVRMAVKQYKLTLVPIARSKAKPLARDLFTSTPQEHLPCLAAATAMAEAGPAAVQARSDAWAARRVRDVLASPANGIYGACWPADLVGAPAGELTAEMKRLLSEPQVTVAVLSLDALADTGGVLDGLEAAGFDIQGPAWK
jgi:uncharacterized protein YbaP (TraB family)